MHGRGREEAQGMRSSRYVHISLSKSYKMVMDLCPQYDYKNYTVTVLDDVEYLGSPRDEVLDLMLAG